MSKPREQLAARKRQMDAQSETMSVPAAGKKYFNLSRNGSYAAAAVGTIPTVKVGRLLRVPVRAMERILDTAK